MFWIIGIIMVFLILCELIGSDDKELNEMELKSYKRHKELEQQYKDIDSRYK